jgi:hypothetical protein
MKLYAFFTDRFLTSFELRLKVSRLGVKIHKVNEAASYLGAKFHTYVGTYNLGILVRNLQEVTTK